MTDKARPLGAKLFLEGMEVPLIGATMTSSINSASIAYIDVVPLKDINAIKPRTHVLISVRDYHNKEGGYPFVKAWEGEVFGYTFNKVYNRRSVTLSCIDFTSYWDNVLTYYFNASAALGKGDQIGKVGMDSVTSEAVGVPFVSIGLSMSSYFKSVMEGSLKKGDLLSGLVDVIKEMSKLNEFYKNASDKLKINERLVMASSGALASLLDSQEGKDWFMGIVNSEQGYRTLRETISSLMSILFHDQITVPFPAGGKDYSFEYIFKPNLFMIAPPCCNVFFPDEYSSFTFTRNFLTEPTRLVYKPEHPTLGEDNSVALPFVYAPTNFSNYMFKQPLTRGKGDFDYPEDKKKYPDMHLTEEIKQKDPKPTDAQRREHHFMTNEERFKGIIFSEEGMVPASSEFKGSIKDIHRSSFATKVANYMLFKKRYQTRELQITSHLKLSVVPGFPALLLDTSITGQNMVAYVTSVTHRIYATEGGYTNVTMKYARTVEEQQVSSGNNMDPLIPPWFAEHIFGKVGPIKISEDSKAVANDISKEATGEDVKTQPYGNNYISNPGETLSSFYKKILGDKGYKAVTDRYKTDTGLVSAVYRLIGEYRAMKADTKQDALTWIGKITDRDYTLLTSAFTFLGASTKTPPSNIPGSNTIEFNGGPFGPEAAGVEETNVRRGTIRKYRDRLKSVRGIHG